MRQSRLRKAFSAGESVEPNSVTKEPPKSPKCFSGKSSIGKIKPTVPSSVIKVSKSRKEVEILPPLPKSSTKIIKEANNMASREEFNELMNEIEKLKAKVASAEEIMRQQSAEIVGLKENISKLESANTTKAKVPSISSAPPRSARKSSVGITERKSVNIPSNTRRSMATGAKSSPRIQRNNGIRDVAAKENVRSSAVSSPRSTKPRRRPLTSKPHVGSMKTKEATFDRETGMMRLFMRGRAVTLPAPLSVCENEDYDVSKSEGPPQESLKLEWAHGFRGRQILQLPGGEIVYPCAALVVLLQPNGAKLQRFYTEHTDDVKCVALHPDRVTVASGQVHGHDKDAGRPHIRIWSSVTLQTARVIGLDGGFDRAVLSLSFSKIDGGSLLAAVDDANEHVLSIYSWATGQRLGDARIGGEAPLGIDFNPTTTSPYEIATWGRFGLVWWSINVLQGTNSTVIARIARMKQATFDAKDRPRAIACATYTNDGSLLIAGDTNGGLSWWAKSKERVGRLMPGAHVNGAVSAIYVSPDGDWLLSAGAKDYTIIKWDITAEPPNVISKCQLSSPATIRALQVNPNGNCFYIGTSGGTILTTNSIEDGSTIQPLIQGHSEEVWGLAVSPVDPSLAISVGYDKHVISWQTSEHRAICIRDLPIAGHSIAFHPNGNIIAIGLQNGEWLAADFSKELHQSIFNQEPIQAIYADHVAREQIECIAFSPDGAFLAAGSRDQHIYIYSVTFEGSTPQFARVTRCSGHSSYITHIDWTNDSKYLRSNSGDYELLFWEACSGRRILFGGVHKDQDNIHCDDVLNMLRDSESWATHSCTLTFSSAGIWPDGADGTDINSANKANGKDLLVIGDDFGKVRLFKYPSQNPRSHSFAANGHSSHVTAASFTANDAKVISVGGGDSAVLQWVLNSDKA